MADTCLELTEEELQLLQPDENHHNRLLKASNDKKLHYLIPKILISERENINVKREKGYQETPLLLALWRGCSLDTLNVLLDAGADVTARDEFGNNALHLALVGECPLPVIRKLLHCNKEMVQQRNNSGETTLMKGLWNGCSPEVFREIVEAGADFTVLDDDKWSHLIWASVGDCCKEILEEIIRRKPDLISYQEACGRIPLHVAKEEWVVRTLIEAGSDAGARDKNGNTPLQYALKQKELSDSTLNLYIEHMSSEQILHVNKHNETLLHTVCEKKYQAKIIRRLMKVGLDPSKINKEGETALHFSASRGALETCKELLRGHPYLFEIKNSNGESVLDITKDVGFAKEMVKWVSLQNVYLAQRTVLGMKDKPHKKDLVLFQEKCKVDLNLFQEHRMWGIFFLNDLLLKNYLTEGDDVLSLSFWKECILVLDFDASRLSVFGEELRQIQRKVL